MSPIKRMSSTFDEKGGSATRDHNEKFFAGIFLQIWSEGVGLQHYISNEIGLKLPWIRATERKDAFTQRWRLRDFVLACYLRPERISTDLSEVFMNWTNQVTYSVVLSLIIAASGCENIALMPRPDVDRGDVGRSSIDRGSEIERGRDARGDAYERTSPRDEIVGTVQRVDVRDRTIQLRTTDGRLTAIRFDPDTVMYSRDRELPVDSLRYGDLIAVQVKKDSRGEQHADVIRINDREGIGTGR
jgi:hypothetical protein